MKFIKSLLFFLLAASLSLTYYSCDDSGLVTTKNDVNSTFSFLKTLNQSTEGIYEAWVSFDSGDHNDAAYVSIGRFNISSSGSIVDTTGNPITLKFNNKPANINLASDAIITIELPGDYDTIPNGIKLMGGEKQVFENELVFDVSMTSNDILGSIAEQLAIDTARFHYATPTSLDTTDELKGIWLMNPYMGYPGLSCLPIADTSDWIYEAFLALLADENTYWSLGKFSDPSKADLDGAGPYQGTDGTGWQRPGQDYVNGSPLPAPNLNSGIYKVVICLVPKSGSLSPYFIKLFQKNLPQMTHHVMSTMDNIVKLPFGQIKVTK
ncbi:MAG: hypothetical protein EHM58_07160 [Ignavibacteriae bacterium]|nr:MAG: hypothetical protein EHM58_07160 [Ignavibacteriota bacterium]